MLVRFVPALALLTIPSLAHAITLEEAQRTPSLAVEITDVRSYEAVRVTVENHGSSEIVVRDLPGVVLENDVATEQDLTLTEPLALAVEPGKRVSVVVSTYCIRPHDQPPHAGVALRARGMDGRIASYLRAYYSPTPRHNIQAAVWRMTDDVRPGAPSSTGLRQPGE